MRPYRRSNSLRSVLLLAALAGIGALALYLRGGTAINPADALARAAGLVESGQGQQAEPLLAIARRSEILAPWVSMLQADIKREQGQLAQAAALYQEIPQLHSPYLDAQVALMEINAEAPQREGQVDREQLVASAEQARRPDLVARIRLVVALSADLPERCRLLRELRQKYPASEAAEEARKEMLSGESRRECEPADAEARLEEAQLLAAEKDFEAALGEAQTAAQLADEESELYFKALLFETGMLRKLARHEEADHLLLLVSADGDAGTADRALLQTAKNAWNVNDHDRALLFLNKLSERFPESELRAEASYILGRVLEELGHFSDAKEAYSKQFEGSANIDFRMQTLLRTAWLYAVSGDYLHAAEQFSILRTEAQSSELEDGTRRAYINHATYWEWYFSEALGEQENGTLPQLVSKEQVIASFESQLQPSYEAVRLLESSLGEELQPLWRRALGGPAPEAGSCSFSLEAPHSSAANALAAGGMRTFLKREIDWALSQVHPTEHPRSILRSTRAALYGTNKLYDHAVGEAEAALAALAAEGLYEKCARTMLETAYPLAYQKEMVEAARASGVELPLLYAIVRTESRFDADAKSSAGALGLAQLMPSTAKEEGWTTEQSLLNPEVNLALGARHLKRLLGAYPEKEFAIAAYNSGAAPVNRWRTRAPKLSAAEWVERIGYPETKAYVKKVLSSKAVYGLLLNSAGEAAPAPTD